MEGLTFDPKKLQLVDINSIRPNSWNPKEKNTEEFKKIKQGIEQKGLRLPIIVRENVEGDTKYEILDGEQRWTASFELGFTEVFIYNEGALDDKQSKELTIWYQQQVPFQEAELAKLVTSMADEFGPLNLPFTEKELADMRELSKFSWDDFKKEETPDGEAPDEDQIRTLNLTMNKAQYEVIMDAIRKLKEAEANADMESSRALELICADYLAS